MYPLSTSPKQSALALADVHLLPVIEFSVMILNAIVHRIHGGDVNEIFCANGEVDYSINGMKLAPPLWKNWYGRTNSTARWIDWAQAHHRNYWWVYTMLWFTHRERMSRLELPPHPSWKMAENWNIGKLFRALPHTSIEIDQRPPEEFPITNEVAKFVQPNKDTVSAYTAYYASMLRYTRARWTGREIPEFAMSAPKLEIVK